jgi:hypothetical protein
MKSIIRSVLAVLAGVVVAGVVVVAVVAAPGEGAPRAGALFPSYPTAFPLYGHVSVPPDGSITIDIPQANNPM